MEHQLENHIALTLDVQNQYMLFGSRTVKLYMLKSMPLFRQRVMEHPSRALLFTALIHHA